MAIAENIKNKVIAYIEKARASYPEVTNDMLCDNGKIFYMNGNDGTDFDWGCNGRACELMCFYKNTKLGFVKIFVQQDGYITGFLYLNKGNGEAIRLEKEFIGIAEAKVFANVLYREADLKVKWDCMIDEFDFTSDDTNLPLSDEIEDDDEGDW